MTTCQEQLGLMQWLHLPLLLPVEIIELVGLTRGTPYQVGFSRSLTFPFKP